MEQMFYFYDLFSRVGNNKKNSIFHNNRLKSFVKSDISRHIFSPVILIYVKTIHYIHYLI